jgi:hypothetical protein
MLSKDLFGNIQVTPQPVGESVPVQMSRKPENPNQYKLFMRPQELMSTIKHSVDEVIVNARRTQSQEDTMSSLWSVKRSELYGPHYASLVKNIEKNGVLRPVTIEDVPGNPLTMGQGHHRVTAAHMVEQNTGKQVYIPVVYDNEMDYTDKKKNFPISLAEAQFRKKRPGFKP